MNRSFLCSFFYFLPSGTTFECLIYFVDYRKFFHKEELSLWKCNELTIFRESFETIFHTGSAQVSKFI